MTIRRAGIGDEEVVRTACRRFFSPGDHDPVGFLRRSEACLLLCEIGDDVVGLAYGHELIHPDGERTMLLYSLDVMERSRGHGQGRALVLAFVEEARRSGCTELWVLTDEANDAALRTYASAGGQRDSKAAVMFTWRLAQGRHSR